MTSWLILITISTTILTQTGDLCTYLTTISLTWGTSYSNTTKISGKKFAILPLLLPLYLRPSQERTTTTLLRLRHLYMSLLMSYQKSALIHLTIFLHLRPLWAFQQHSHLWCQHRSLSQIHHLIYQYISLSQLLYMHQVPLPVDFTQVWHHPSHLSRQEKNIPQFLRNITI